MRQHAPKCNREAKQAAVNAIRGIGWSFSGLALRLGCPVALSCSVAAACSNVLPSCILSTDSRYVAKQKTITKPACFRYLQLTYWLST